MFGITSANAYGGKRATDFDGTDDFLETGADLSGIADGKTGTLSTWVNLDSVAAAQVHLCNVVGSASRFLFHQSVALPARLSIVGVGTDAANKLVMTNNTNLTTATWYHLLASWDLASAIGNLYINGSSDLAAGAVLTNANIDYTGTNWRAGTYYDASRDYNGRMSAVYFSTRYLDITSAPIRKRFFAAALKPGILGLRGQLADGQIPLIWMPDGKTNMGTGGVFSPSGGLAAAAGPLA